MNPTLFTELSRALNELAPTVRARASEAERSAELAAEVVAHVKASGLFKLWVPAAYGGFELDLPRALRLYEAAAAIDGSFGWAIMIGAGGGLFGAYLRPESARELFSPTQALVAGSGAPSGRAERVADGYRVNGRWRYASGARHASVFTANCVLTSDGAPVLDSAGKPLIRAMAFAPSEVRIVPTWDATGMRATGSHDIEVDDAFVPEARTFSVFTDTPRESGALYRLPFAVLTQLPVAAVAAGVARHALDAFAALAAGKGTPGSVSSLASDPNVCSRYAESHARWLNVQLALHALALRTWEDVVAGMTPSAGTLAEIAASSAVFVAELEGAVGSLARIAGMSAIARDEEFARAWRDLQTLAAHQAISPLLYAPAGEILLEAQRVAPS